MVNYRTTYLDIIKVARGIHEQNLTETTAPTYRPQYASDDFMPNDRHIVTDNMREYNEHVKNIHADKEFKTNLHRHDSFGPNGIMTVYQKSAPNKDSKFISVIYDPEHSHKAWSNKMYESTDETWMEKEDREHPDLYEIAKKHLPSFRTFHTYNSDHLDFREHHNNSILKALKAAYEAGHENAASDAAFNVKSWNQER